MGIKEKLTRLIPSYRSRDVIVKELSIMNIRMSQKLDQMNKQIANLNAKNDYLFFCLQHLEGETGSETRKRVFLEMPKAEGDLRLIQQISNNLLSRLKDICDRHSLKFFLMAGTLVGAMRHEGYIPWDDDIDIGMMKCDYEKLVEILKDDNDINISTYYGINGNRQIKVKLKQSDKFFVDIYLFDYIDVCEENINKRWEETQSISKTIEKVIHSSFPTKEMIGNLSRPVKLESVEQAVIQCTKEMYEKYDYLGKGDYFCPAVDMPSSFRKSHPILRVEDLFPLGEMVFEGRKYGVWKNYMKYFDSIYNPWNLPNSITPHLLKEYGDVHMEIENLHREGIEV